MTHRTKNMLTSAVRGFASVKNGLTMWKALGHGVLITDISQVRSYSDITRTKDIRRTTAFGGYQTIINNWHGTSTVQVWCLYQTSTIIC